MKQRGALIVIEGPDHSGKTTQVTLLGKNLENVVTMRFPNRTTPIGKQIDAYLKCADEDEIEFDTQSFRPSERGEINDRVIHLLFSANRWELSDKITDLINDGKTVILDRYSYSGIAYSMSKGLSYEWCMAPDANLPKPDAVIYLSISAENVCKRMVEEKLEIYENPSFQKRVIDNFEYIYNRDLNTGYVWNRINADRSQQEVYASVLSVVNNTIKNVVINGDPLAVL